MNRAFAWSRTFELPTPSPGNGWRPQQVTDTSRLHRISISTGLCCFPLDVAYPMNSVEVVSLCLPMRNSLYKKLASSATVEIKRKQQSLKQWLFSIRKKENLGESKIIILNCGFKYIQSLEFFLNIFSMPDTVKIKDLMLTKMDVWANYMKHIVQQWIVCLICYIFFYVYIYVFMYMGISLLISTKFNWHNLCYMVYTF